MKNFLLNQYKVLSIVCLALFLAVVASLYWVRDSGAQRHEVTVLVVMFMELKTDIELALDNSDRQVTVEAIYKKWSDIEKRDGRDIADFFINTSGQVVLVDADKRFVLYFERKSNSDKKWICSSIPKMESDSVCTSLNRIN